MGSDSTNGSDGLVGHRYGRLLVVGFRTTPKGRVYLCKCDCGADGVPALSQNLSGGRKQSCGCLRRELMRERARKNRAKSSSMETDSKEIGESVDAATGKTENDNENVASAKNGSTIP